MQLAERLKRLGTETAFKVSAEANAFAAKGNRVYPFHLGDINIPTPHNIVEASFKAIRDGKTGYCPNGGIAPLREALAADINRSHGTHYTIDNVCIQPGGKPVIGKFLLTVMNPGDEVLYPNPGFPIYESLIEFHGGRGLPYSYHEGKTTFELDLDGMERMITPKTRILILNDLQNPTGAEASAQELNRIAELARKHNLYVLCDEAYFDVRFSGRSRSLVSLPGMEERCVVLYTFGKKFAMTGWRLGAAIGPKEAIEMITRLNVNEESCPNHFIQYGAIEALTGDQSGCAAIIRTLKERRDEAVQILNSIPGIKCLKPEVTFYLYPNVTELMKRKDLPDYDALRTTVLHKTGVSFCTRQHFGRIMDGERQFYIRLAYSGINTADIEEGLTKLKAFAEA